MIYFTADLHLHHPKILEITNRPYHAIYHDEAIVNKINATVSTNDILYVLGDAAVDRTRNVWNIHCWNRHLIWGNHDNRDLTESFRTSNDTLLLKAEDKLIFLSHYAHAYWPSSHVGGYHLYGHTHAAREETLDTIWPERRSMDVGVDNAYRLLGDYRPFSFDEVMEILKDRKGHDDLEFYKQLDKNRQEVV